MTHHGRIQFSPAWPMDVGRTLGWNPVAPPFLPTTYLEDHFNNTGGANVALAGWVPDTAGVAWSYQTGSPATNLLVSSANDQVIGQTSSAGFAISKVTIPSPNYKVKGKFNESAATFSAPSVLNGALDSAFTTYRAFRDGSGGGNANYGLQRLNAGVSTTLATILLTEVQPRVVSLSRYVFADAIGVGGTRTRLKMVDETNGCTVGYDDLSGSQITAPNFPGLSTRLTGTVDDITAVSIAPMNRGGLELVPDGIRSWFVMPDSLVVAGRTYVGYVTSAGGIGLARLYQGVVSLSLLKAILEGDDHDNCTLYLLPDGRLIALYCRHSTVDTFIRYRITTLPLSSITTWDDTIWDAEQQISTGGLTCAYPKGFSLTGGGDLAFRVLYRAGSGTQRDQVMASCLMSDLIAGTPTWTLTTVIQQSNNRPYVQGRLNPAKTQWGYTATTGHPSEVSASIYGGFFTMSGGVMVGRKSDGTSGGALPNIPSTGLTLIQNTTGGTNWNMDFAWGADGNPRALIARYPTDPFILGLNKMIVDIEYWNYKCDGSGNWSGFRFATGQHSLYPNQNAYPGNACYDGNDTNIVYSAQWDTSDAVYKTSQYAVDEGAQTHTLTRTIFADGSAHQFRPSSPEGHGADCAVTAVEGGYSNYLNGFQTTMRYAAAA